MFTRRIRPRQERLPTVGSAEGGVRKDRLRRRGQRPRRGSNRVVDATKPVRRAVKPAVDATEVSNESSEDKKIEEGSVGDVGAEYIEYAVAASAEEGIQFYQRLYKKRSNMALALYHKNHPDERYKFLQVHLSNVCRFMEYRLEHPANMHMNFVALDVKSGFEKLFFAELCLINDIEDDNSGYAAITCEIVEHSSAGGRKDKYFFPDGKYPPDYHDGENCYACTEEIKHPPGASYRAGQDVFGYGV